MYTTLWVLCYGQETQMKSIVVISSPFPFAWRTVHSTLSCPTVHSFRLWGSNDSLTLHCHEMLHRTHLSIAINLVKFSCPHQPKSATMSSSVLFFACRYISTILSPSSPSFNQKSLLLLISWNLEESRFFNYEGKQKCSIHIPHSSQDPHNIYRKV